MTVAHEDEGLPWLYFSLTDEASEIGPSPHIVTLPSITSTSKVSQQTRTFLDTEIAASDNEFMDRMVKLAFNLFLIMEARPTLLRNGKLERKTLKKDRVTEFWTPHVLGFDYQVKRVREQELTGAVTMVTNRRNEYWVRGHGKQQAHGQNRSLRKHIWIEPYYVAPD